MTVASWDSWTCEWCSERYKKRGEDMCEVCKQAREGK